MKYLLLLTPFFLLSCGTPNSYRLPSSLETGDSQPRPLVCGVKCAIGPADKKFFHIRTIKTIDFPSSQIASGGSVTSDAINKMSSHCEQQAQSLSSKSEKPYRYIAVSPVTPVYHGQILPVDGDDIELTNGSSYRINVYNACRFKKKK